MLLEFLEYEKVILEFIFEVDKIEFFFEKYFYILDDGKVIGKY